MIPDVDVALEALVRRDALSGSRVEVAFDAPTKEWVSRRNAPALDLYLYDIREDLSRRQVGPEPVRDPGTRLVSEHRLPVRRFRLSYMITAWTQRPEDEHRLLAACLATFCRHEFIPRDLVTGALVALPVPVYLQVALPPPQDRSIADVWSALGGELKPSLDLVAIAPLDPGYRAPAAKPVLEEPILGIGGPGISREALQRVALGSGVGAAPIGPDTPASVEELVTGRDVGIGRPAVAGESDDKAGASATTRRRRRGAGRSRDAVETMEEAEGGAPAAPIEDLGGGRVVRVRGIPRP